MPDLDDFREPLVLELVPDGDNIRFVHVDKCPPMKPDSAQDMNQRGHEAWPEITVWPRGTTWRLYHGSGALSPISGEHSRWTVKMWPLEQYVYLKEVRGTLDLFLDDLPNVQPLPRRRGTEHYTEPQAEDFGRTWYKELQDMKRKPQKKKKLK